MLISSLTSAHFPDHCDPQNDFLHHFSAAFGSCVPTNFAFASVLLGSLSIAAWLFAQLPQIIKNYKIKSTSGLSIFFLIEWCLGDISNFVGAILTRQTTWQIIIGVYYCLVDCTLVLQWMWYEHLHHGRRLHSAWKRRSRSGPSRSPDVDGQNFEVLEAAGSSAASDRSSSSGPHTPALEVPFKADASSGLFRHVDYGSVSKDTSLSVRRPKRLYHAEQPSLPAPSPRTVLLLALLVAMAQASPTIVSTQTQAIDLSTSRNVRLDDILGTALSWCSTGLYLGSRLPQLVQNARRRSTAGLSLTLFIAAFFGNLFYSLSLLINPLAWKSYSAYGCHGWVRDIPSKRDEWVIAATPFFLGAAGVLAMDAAVGLQFWWYRSTQGGKDREIIVVRERRSGGWTWREVNGWMRGWKPSLSSVRDSPINPEDGDDQTESLISHEGGGHE